MNMTTAIKLFFLLLILGGIVYLRSGGTQSCTETIFNLFDDPAGDGIDPERQRQAMDEARKSPPAERLEIYLEWIARGSSVADGELHIWLETDFEPGSLAQRRQGLEELVVRWPDGRVRQATAQVLLRDRLLPAAEEAMGVLKGDGRDPEAAVDGDRGNHPEGAVLKAELEAVDSLWLHGVVAGDAGGDEEAKVLDLFLSENQEQEGTRQLTFRALSSQHKAGMDALLGHVRKGDLPQAVEAGEAVGMCAVQSPGLRVVMVPQLLPLLEEGNEGARQGAQKALVSIAGKDMGSPAAWERWWDRTKRLIERYDLKVGK